MVKITKPNPDDRIASLKNTLYFVIVRGGKVLLPSSLYETKEDLQEAAEAARRRFSKLRVRIVDTDTERLFPGLQDVRPELEERDEDEP